MLAAWPLANAPRSAYLRVIARDLDVAALALMRDAAAGLPDPLARDRA